MVAPPSGSGPRTRVGLARSSSDNKMTWPIVSPLDPGRHGFPGRMLAPLG